MERVRHRCSFCLQVPPPDRRLVAGPGVYICAACLDSSLALVADLDHQVVPDEAVPLRPEETMTDSEILEVFPAIATVHHQVDQELRRWVNLARRRGLSWTRIGAALNITRQTAWQRFATTDHPK